MADSTLHPAPGAPYLNLSDAMQAFYARRGMWRDGAPAGMLAQWLGERCPWTGYGPIVAHWIAPGGLDALAADALAAPPQAWQTYHQRAQFLRRLREAGQRAGMTPAASIGSAAEAAAPGAAVVALPPAVPFEPLRVPTGGKARAAFEVHVMRTVRELVEFTQGSMYSAGEAP